MVGRKSCSCHHNHHHREIPEQEKQGQKFSEEEEEEDEQKHHEEETETTTVPKNNHETESDGETDIETDFETESEYEIESDDSENIMELDTSITDAGVVRTVRGLEIKWKQIERGSEEICEKNWCQRVLLKCDFETKLISTATLVSILVVAICTIKYIYS